MSIFSARRGAVVLGSGLLLAVGAAGPAFAHVEVEATPAQALATGATLTLRGEAESDSAGVTGARIQLPAGLLPADLRLLAGPRGWRLTGAGQVATFAGPALPVGQDLQLRFRVRQLPAGDRLVLKTVQTYSDGREDGWVELPSASVPEPDSPAPVVTLAAAAPGAVPLPRETAAAPSASAAPPSAAPTSVAPTSVAPTSAAAPPAAADDEAGAGSAGWLFGGVGIGVVLLGGVVLALRRLADRQAAETKAARAAAAPKSTPPTT